MKITLYKQVDVSGMPKEAVEELRKANALLKPIQHARTCPVFNNASADCVWPFSVCCGVTFDNVYVIIHEPRER